MSISMYFEQFTQVRSPTSQKVPSTAPGVNLECRKRRGGEESKRSKEKRREREIGKGGEVRKLEERTQDKRWGE